MQTKSVPMINGCLQKDWWPLEKDETWVKTQGWIVKKNVNCNKAYIPGWVLGDELELHHECSVS